MTLPGPPLNMPQTLFSPQPGVTVHVKSSESRSCCCQGAAATLRPSTKIVAASGSRDGSERETQEQAGQSFARFAK